MLKYFYCLFFSFLVFTLVGQSETKPEITGNLFIQNAMVIPYPGAIPSKQSVEIRKGVIANVGAGLKPPFDCRVILADSFYLYAGFIDAMSHTGIKKEEENKDAPKPASKGEATLGQSGITPQWTALQKINPKDISITDMRRSGFTVNHVFPRGKMIGGKSSIISLGSREEEDQLVIRNEVSMYASFTPSTSVYPSTIIGVFAKFRDVFKNTELYIKNKSLFELNPNGLTRPAFSEELEALVPVYKKEKSMFFATKNLKEVYRAMELQKEIGFSMVLAEVTQVKPILNQLSESKVPVLLSLDLPDEWKEDKKTEVKKDSTQSDSLNIFNIEKKKLEERKKQSYNDYLAQAGILEKHGIPFSFSYLDIRPSDVLKSIRRYIKGGLTEKTALAALTTVPAQLLKIQQTHGTVEKGKSANLVLTQKPLFDEKSSIKYVLVDGKVFEFYETPKEGDKKNEKGERPESSLYGSWTYTGTLDGQTQNGTLVFSKDSNSTKAEITSDNFPEEKYTSSDVEVKDQQLTFSFDAMLAQPTKIKFVLTIDKETLKGSIQVGEGNKNDITAIKKKNPEFKF